MATETTNPLSITNLRKHLVITPVFRLQENSYIQLQGKTTDAQDARLSQNSSVTKTFIVRRINYAGPININVTSPASNLGITTNQQFFTIAASTKQIEEFSVVIQASQTAPVTSTLPVGVAQQSIVTIRASATGIPSVEQPISVVVNQSNVNNTINVTLASNSIRQQETTTATATVTNYQNNILTLPITWSSSDPSIASITSAGDSSNTFTQGSNIPVTVRGLAVGTARIIARNGTLQAEAVITVGQRAQVIVSFSENNVPPGKTGVVATARAVDANGTALSNRTFSWSSSNTAIATINQSGNITPLAVGTTVITATDTATNITGTATFVVISAGTDGGVTFDKDLNTQLIFNWTRGATAGPAPISVRATNTSTTKTYSVRLTAQNAGVSIVPSNFNLQPGANQTFVITTPLVLLNTLPDNQSIIGLTVTIT